MNAALVLAAATVAAPVESPNHPCGAATVATRAEYMMPTERYRHGALGDMREWGGLVYDGAFHAGVVLGPEAVFEDVAPRLADFEGDCDPEIVAVETHETEGAQLVVYQADRGRLRKIAATPAPGRRFGFIAPVAVAELTGDGQLDVALVAEPHGEGRLEVWTFAPGGLTRVAAASGFSNHRFGEPAASGGFRRCGATAELVLADRDWTRTLITRVEDGAIRAEPYADDADPETLARALDCR